MGKRWMLGVALLGLLAPMGACTNSTGGSGSGNGGGGGNGNIDPQGFCSGLCGRVHSCDNTQDEQTCADSCTNTNAAILPKLRGDVVSATETCIENKDCATVLGSNFVSVCVSQAAASIAPSQQAMSFCQSLSAADTKCGATLDMASCLDTVKIYSDSTISEGGACTQKACTDIDACLSATFDLSTSSPSPSSSGGGSGSGSGGPGSSSGAPPGG